MTKPTPLLSKVAFGALLTYSPRGISEISIKSRGVCTSIKGARPATVARAVEVLVEVVRRGQLTAFFGEDVTLVPAPRSSPLLPGWLWPAETIANEMVRAGLGKEVLACVKRITKVQKSALARLGERPTAEEHRASMHVEATLDLLQPQRITIVDDVVTKGATLLACATLVQDAFPSSQVRVFGVIRTRGIQREIDNVVDPCEGEITWDGRTMKREP